MGLLDDGLFHTDLTFEEAWERRETVAFGDTAAIFISREDLILSKQASGRPQDLMDLENLRRGI